VYHGIDNYLIVIAGPFVLHVILLVAVFFMEVDADPISPVDIAVNQLDDPADVQEWEYPLRGEKEAPQVDSLHIM
jgi:hypothetical protein